VRLAFDVVGAFVCVRLKKGEFRCDDGVDGYMNKREKE
jgi:hypothetical protein